MTGDDGATLGGTSGIGTCPVLASGCLRQLVADVNREAVDNTDLAVTNDRLAVAHELSLCQIRRHQRLAGSRVDDQITLSFRHVLFVQHSSHRSDGLQDVRASQRNRGVIHAEVVGTRQTTSGCALVGSSAALERTAQNGRIDCNFHLHRSVVREHVHQLWFRLHSQHVVHLEREVLALVDLQRQGVRSRNFIRQVGANRVVVDSDRRDVVDNNLIAQRLDVAFPVSVGNFAKHSGRVELGVQLGRPQGRDKGTRIGRVGVKAVANRQYSSRGDCAHSGLLIKRKKRWYCFWNPP